MPASSRWSVPIAAGGVAGGKPPGGTTTSSAAKKTAAVDGGAAARDSAAATSATSAAGSAEGGEGECILPPLAPCDADSDGLLVGGMPAYLAAQEEQRRQRQEAPGSSDARASVATPAAAAPIVTRRRDVATPATSGGGATSSRALGTPLSASPPPPQSARLTFAKLSRALLRWHAANLEDGCARSVMGVSLQAWDQDDAHNVHDGDRHTFNKDGYDTFVRGLVHVSRAAVSCRVASRRCTRRRHSHHRPPPLPMCCSLSPSRIKPR